MNDLRTATYAYAAARAAYEAALAAAEAVSSNDDAWFAAMIAADDAYAAMLTTRNAYWAAEYAAVASPAVVAPRTIDTAAVATLRQYALDSYEAGGHWVYETHDNADYQKYIDEAAGDIAAAKRALRAHWELTESVGNDIANA